jgi:hypothetical protein
MLAAIFVLLLFVGPLLAVALAVAGSHYRSAPALLVAALVSFPAAYYFGMSPRFQGYPFLVPAALAVVSFVFWRRDRKDAVPSV